MAIADVGSDAGYRLELRHIDHGEGGPERERVKEQLVELEHRLEYLNGAKNPARNCIGLQLLSFQH